MFLLVNLGCEMLYVVDQRLKAQEIGVEKSTQGKLCNQKNLIFKHFLAVMRETTSVLLDPNFLERAMVGAEELKTLLTADYCKFILRDIACSSLMRLDEQSMGKLWDLMTMIFKWQLFLSKYPQHLLEITFRHLDGVSNLYPEVKKTILVDYTKNKLLDYWNVQSELQQRNIYVTVKSWLECFNVKIAVLIRLGFQGEDAIFITDVSESYFSEFRSTLGANIYLKSYELASSRKEDLENMSKEEEPVKNYNSLATQLNCQDRSSMNLFGRNIIFDELEFDLEHGMHKDDHFRTKPENKKERKSNTDDFVKIRTATASTGAGSSSMTSWEDIVINRNATTAFVKDFKDLLNRK